MSARLGATRSGRAWTRLSAGLLAVGLLTVSCGSNPQDVYCSALSQDQAMLTDMVSSSRADSLLAGLPLLERLAAKAPADLTDEWQTFLNAVDGLRAALEQAGVTARDFTDHRVPASVQGTPRRTLIAAASNLASSGVVDAAKGIESQARDVCKVNLGL